MVCPYCNHQDHLEHDLHSDGFSSSLVECALCGALLKTSQKAIETVFGLDRSFYAHKVVATPG